jgi:hypothetical protein
MEALGLQDHTGKRGTAHAFVAHGAYQLAVAAPGTPLGDELHPALLISRLINPLIFYMLDTDLFH